jgi:O2-independent ubiquinone biosynthesis protein UbiV
MAMSGSNTGDLTLGPVLFNWAPERWHDFYFRIADEAPVDLVYVGEVVCYKRAPLFSDVMTGVVARLQAAGKTVVYSTLAEVMSKQERTLVEDVCACDGVLIEANDGSSLARLRGRPHHVGPFVNVYNERTLAVLARNGARSVCVPPEMPGVAIDNLCGPAADRGVSIEAQVFGRVPLALSARCYHARAHGRTKDTCQFVCDTDPDGMALRTLEDKPFLSVNGVQTMSHAYLNLIGDVLDLRAMGVSRFRLSPHTCDMVAVARAFRDVLDGRQDVAEGQTRLAALALDAPFCDGFYAGDAGQSWSRAAVQ